MKTKETFFGSWEDYERETGMSKKQYFEHEKKLSEELSEIEVESSILIK